jgi:uncharacterized membrane protein
MVVLFLVVIVLAIAVARLQQSIRDVRDELADARLKAQTDTSSSERLNALQRRIAALEARFGPTPEQAAQAVETPRETTVEARPPEAVHAPMPVIEASTPPAATEELAAGFARQAADVPPAVTAPAATAALEAPAAPVSASEPAPTQQEGWEVVVGTSWLNKIGVVVFVVGLALLLGYSVANVGPLGRVAMGFALSLGMLGTGVALERRESYRNYAYGLIGGGWAGVYFTAYAMHALPAALVVESELVGAISLVIVAAGMIVHSLRYQSETLTGLAYIAAYAPLAFSPLSTFSLVATVPLTVSLLTVASRFAWSGIAVLGIVSTYAIFILRTSTIGAADGTTTLHLVLWTYWLLFEAADISARRRGPARHTAPLFVLNAAGFLGAILLHTQADEGQWGIVAAAGLAYLVSALVRMFVVDRTGVRADRDAARPFTTMHGATAVAAALFAYAIDRRFAGTRETIAFLLETQFLVAAGIALADRHIRRAGTAAAFVTTAHLIGVLFLPLAPFGFDSVLAASPTALLVAAAWHINREWFQRKGITLDPVEGLYSWVALGLVLNVIAREVPGAYRGPASMVWAVLLLEGGLRRATEYRYQAYVALAAASVLTYAAFGPGPVASRGNAAFHRDLWIALPAVIALAYGFAARLLKRAATADCPIDVPVAAGVASTIALAFVVLFEGHAAPRETVPAFWAATAAAAVAFGGWRRGPVFRWQGYVLAAFSAFVPLTLLALDAADSRQQYVTALVVIAFLYVSGYLGRATALATSVEAAAAGGIAFLGNAIQALFVWRVVPMELVAPVWALSATALVTIGALRGRPWQRWQAYALVVIATARTFVLFDVLPLSARLALASASVIALSYIVGYLGRAIRRPRPETTGDIETVAAGLLSYVASFHLWALSLRLLPETSVAAAWVTAAIALTAIGIWRGRRGQRGQGYAVFAASIVWMLRDLAGPHDRDMAAVMWMAFCILATYVTALVIRPALARAAANDGPTEETARVGLLVAATLVLSGLLMDEVGTRLATLAWALQGAALLVVGFLMRERVLRLSGLALLFVCILKLFAYDLRQLEALARILSFVVLGLVLLTVSWIYTRYRDQIRKLL